MTNKIIIFDTTLRDGDQASGFHFLKDEKLLVARQLARLGVDVIEAGFASSSPGDYESVYLIAKEIGKAGNPTICSLARAKDSDIEIAARALEPAYKPRIHTFIATSDIHIEDKFKKSRQWVIDTAANAIRKARGYVYDVEFSTEDFSRSDLNYIVEVVAEAIKAGAGTINLPDTVGFFSPNESYEKVRYVINKLNELGLNAIISVHNHNDLGMATANTLEAIRAGARQIEVTMNQMGERAGNTSLEQIIAAVKVKGIGEVGLDTKLIGETSRLVSRLTGIYPTPNTPIIGSNAFSHEAGIHQDGVLKSPVTYEIMKPEDFGVEGEITYGPRSGRNAIRNKLNKLGIKLSDEEFERTFNNFKRITDNKKVADDCDLIMAVIGDFSIPEHYKLIDYTPLHSNGVFASVVELEVDGVKRREYAEGDGLINASINSIGRMIGNGISFKKFKCESDVPGSEALGQTRLVAAKNTWEALGDRAHTDVVTSSIQAYLEAINRLRYIEQYFSQKP